MNITTESTTGIVVIDPVTQPLRDHYRSRNKLQHTLERLFVVSDINRILLVTCTFPKGTERKEAMVRFRKLLRALSTESRGYLWVFERSLGGHVHFHLLLLVDFDTRDGVDLEKYSRLANDALSAKRKLVNGSTRKLWTTIDRLCRDFQIGRTEVAPIYTNAEAIKWYLLKSVAHNWHYRQLRGVTSGCGDRGACWWSCSRNLKAVYGRFSRCRSRFREEVAIFAEARGISDIDSLKEKYGPRWAWCVSQSCSSHAMSNVFPARGGGVTRFDTRPQSPTVTHYTN